MINVSNGLPARRALSIRVLILVLGIVGALALVALSVASSVTSSEYAASQDEVATSRQITTQATTTQPHVAQALAALYALSWQVSSNGAGPTLATGAPVRAAYQQAVATVDADLKKMPTALMAPAEKATFDQMTASWAAFTKAGESALAAYAAGSSPTAGDALVSGAATKAAGDLDKSTAALTKQVRDRGKVINDDANANDARLKIVQYVVLGLGLVAVVLITVLVLRRFRTGLAAVTASMRAVAAGDLTKEPQVASHDEMGELAALIRQAIENVRVLIRSVASSADDVRGAAAETATVSSQAGTACDDTTRRLTEVGVVAEGVSTSIQTVAAGTEEMTASIREIAKNANDAAGVASSAV